MVHLSGQLSNLREEVRRLIDQVLKARVHLATLA